MPVKEKRLTIDQAWKEIEAARGVIDELIKIPAVVNIALRSGNLGAFQNVLDEYPFTRDYLANQLRGEAAFNL